MFPLSLRLSLLGSKLLVIIVALTPLIRAAYPLPLETFREPLSVDCGEGLRECAGVLRVPYALGRHTGIYIVKGLEGDASIRAGRPKGTLKIQADGVSELSITFSWDGDSNPEVLSGSGLNCLDLTRGGAYAFILSELSAEPECREDVFPSECPQFTIESRVYDSQDPTGQRFSASVLVRGAMIESDLAIPFSNFVRLGPRGKGSFTCVGAVTITMKFSGLDELDLAVGPIYTNGEEGMEVPPAADLLSPTPTSTPKVTGTAKTEPLTFPAILALPDGVVPAVSADSGVQTPGGQAVVQELPSSSVKSQPLIDAPAAVPREVAAREIRKVKKAPEEVVYGSVVTGE